MGDILVSALVRDVLRRLTSIAIKEFGLVWGLKDHLLRLQRDFNHIQVVLEDAEKKCSKEKTIELWLKRLRSESQKMENVLDEVSTEVMLRKLHKELGIKYAVRDFFSSYHHKLMFRTRIAHKIKALRENIAEIEAQGSKLNLTPSTTSVDVDARVTDDVPNRETSSLINSSMIHGRDKATENVIEKICNNKTCKHDVDNIRVYAICGMGGLGKTTLAQLVYNHEKVNKHFEIKCWMYVSEKFQVKELIKGIIESIGDCNGIPSQLDALHARLQNELQGKRFFIVMDDVWIEDAEKSEWDILSNALSCGAKGSIVLVTTRNKTTSRMVAKLPELRHELECLSEKDSWLLFEKLAFADGRAGGDIRELEPIGKEIVEKCKGLPLAVKTLGGLMWSKTSTREWEHVMRSNIWELQDNNILPALKLSYDNLLPHIKRCFSYCCLFPKGYDLEKDLLILLWMANGFLPSRGGETDLYVLGEEIYNLLVWRSFFQVVDGEYKMHDLMHDLAEHVMRHDRLIIEPGKNVITLKEVLHLSISCHDFIFSDQHLEKLRLLRSVMVFNVFCSEGCISQIFDFVNLRVLYMVGIGLHKLPESIANLKYLKYLNLSWSSIKVLPTSIIYLQNLQMLLLEGCGGLYDLPERMRYMRNLQHLNIKGCDNLDVPAGILKALTSLRLTKLRLRKKIGVQIGELGDLKLVKDNLEIDGLENIEGGLSEAKNANLKSKANMLNLRLQWGYGRIGCDDEEVLEGLEPNPNLRELEIFGYKKKNISPSWIVNLKNLVKIEFFNCTNCENIPPLGKLHSLKSITLSVMYSLKCFHDDDNINTTATLFPSLQELIIEDCSKFVSLPSNFPKLDRLYLSSCESLLSLPDESQNFKDLKQLEITNCKNLRRRYDKEMGGVDWHKISHIPHIAFKD